MQQISAVIITLNEERNLENCIRSIQSVADEIIILDSYSTDATLSIAEKYKCPIVVTGFEPVDLLQGILMAVQQLEKGVFKVENQYARSVQRDARPQRHRTSRS